MEKWVKQMIAGGAQLTFGGIVTTEDEMGRKTYHEVGLFWDPRRSETGRTVEAKNHVSIHGDPGPKVSIKVFAASLREHGVIEEIPPSFVNERRGIKVWEYEAPIAVFIDGERQAENWTLSYWRMFSGMVVFDVAKNRLQLERTQNRNLDNGDGKLNDDIKQTIASAQLDNGHGKNNGRRSKHVAT